MIRGVTGLSLMHIPLGSISERDLLALVENKVIEAKTIEYKEALPGNSDREKLEFLADVTSFANASGGDIIFGVRTKDGVPVDLCGLKQIIPDQEIARLENIMRDGISPRIVSKDLRAIRLQNGAEVIILRIPRSWALPHMVTYKKHFRFYTRNTNGKHPMDVSRAGRGKLDRRLSGKLLPRDERSSGNGKKTEEEPHGGLQGQGGAGGGQGGKNRSGDRRDLRRPPQPGHAVEKAAFGKGLRGLREGEAPGGGPQRA
ncbi:MAG: ATP-binding protein [Actinobacteria bacterium]|nr:ATP-binding protein [Actinomycetota bacterium]